LTPAIEEERKIERDLQMLALRLTQFGDVNWVIQQLRDIRQRQQDIRDQTRGKVRGPEAADPPGGGAGEGGRP
jgi:hypothetical protein